MMWRISVIALGLCLLCVSHVMCQDEAAPEAVPGDREIVGMFNCLRPGQNCEGDVNATVCGEEDGVCTCEAGLTGFDCSLNETSEVLGPEECSDAPCENEGLCVRSETDGSPACYCANSAFYGPTCAEERVTHLCQVDSVEMKITPFSNTGGFAGLIYVSGQIGDECALVDDGTGTYVLSLGFDECGGADNTTTSEGDVMWQFKIVVQYDDLFIFGTDQEFTFTCIVKQTDSLVTDEETDLNTDPEDPGLEQQEVTQEVLPVDVQIVTAADDTPVTGPVRIGTLLKLIMTLRGGEVYDSFRVESLLCHNGDESESIPFIESGCVTDVAGRNGKKIVTDFSGEGTSVVSLTFKLFKFRSTNQLKFKLGVKLCKGTGGCNATECATSPFSGLGRRKRAAELAPWDIHEAVALPEDSEDRFGDMSTGLVVLLPTENSFNGKNEWTHQHVARFAPTHPTTELCFRNAVVLLVLLLTAILCLGCGLVCSWYFTRMRQARQKQAAQA